MTVRLPKDLYEQLRREAFEERTSQTAIITEALKDRFAQRSLRGKAARHRDGNPRNNDLSNLEITEAQ